MSRACRIWEGGKVWERLWRHEPDDARDAALLAVERTGPRWTRLRRAVVEEFGRIEGLETIELGSGRGDMSVLLAENGAAVTLVDQEGGVLEQAERRFARLGLKARLVQGDLFNLAAELRGRFAVSVSLGVVEHFSGPKRTRALAAHGAVLAPGGLTMVSVPHAACAAYRLWKAYLELRGWWPYGTEVPFWRGEMRRRSGEAGLTPVDLFAYGWWESVGQHWVRGVFHRECGWLSRRSVLDAVMGANLVLLARKEGSGG